MSGFERLIVRDPWFGPPVFWRATEMNLFNTAILATIRQPTKHGRLILGAFALLYSANPERMKN